MKVAVPLRVLVVSKEISSEEVRTPIGTPIVVAEIALLPEGDEKSLTAEKQAMNSDDEMQIDQNRPVVWADGKWRIGGFVAYFHQEYEWLRQYLPSLPPYLPLQCVDPAQISRFFGISLDEFDWKGPDSSQVLAAIERVEGRLGTDTVRKSVSDAAAQMLTTKEVSILLGCSYSQARTLMLDGRIKSVKTGRFLRSRKEWVEEFLISQIVKKPDPEPGEVRTRRPKAKLVGHFKKGGLAYEFLRSRPD